MAEHRWEWVEKRRGWVLWITKPISARFCDVCIEWQGAKDERIVFIRGRHRIRFPTVEAAKRYAEILLTMRKEERIDILLSYSDRNK